MARLNLKNMSVDDLVKLRDRVQAELSRKVETERTVLQRQIEALSELEAGTAKAPEKPGASAQPRRKPRRGKTARRPARKAARAAKYRGPNGETWTGRGRAPRWLTALEAEGNSREDFLTAK